MDIFDQLAVMSKQYAEQMRAAKEQYERIHQAAQLFPSLHLEETDEHFHAREVEPKQAQPTHPLSF